MPGEVVQTHDTAPRSYIVRTEEGSVIRRNRRHLIRTNEDPPSTALPIEGGDSEGGQVPEDAVANAPERVAAGGELKTRCGRVVRPPVRFKDYV
jgi:hypothetical protein